MALKISLHPGRVRGLPDQVWDRTRKFKLAITSGDAHIMPLDPPPAHSNERSPTGNEEHSQAPKPIEPYRVHSLKRRVHAIRCTMLFPKSKGPCETV